MGISITHDIVPDTPTNNFATLNPLAILLGVTVSNGNLTNTTTTDNARRNVFSSIAAPKNSGKFYAEFCVTTVGDSNSINVGVSSTVNTVYQSYMGGSADSYAYMGFGQKGHNNSFSSYGSAFSTAGAGGIIGVLIDTDNGDLTFYLNNSSMGTAYTGINFEEYFFGIGRSADAVNVYQVNFGQDPSFGGNKTSGSADAPDANGIGAFYYQPPTDALALCSANLPEMTPDVTGDVPQDYFKTVIWTGQTADSTFIDNGDGTWSKTGVGFQPDFVWLKSRSLGASNGIYDSVRGAANWLRSDGTSEEQYQRSNGYLNSFDSNGFTLAEGSSTDPTYTGSYETNQSGETYVGWCWKSGGSPSATDDGTGVSDSAKLVDTSGAASSTTCKSFKDAAVTAGASYVICPTKMSINQAAGFSIVKWTGTGANATVPHGLSSAPEMIIVKNLDDTGRYWIVYHHKVSSTPHKDFLYLNEPDGAAAQPLYWNNTYPTSSVFSLGSAGAANRDGDAHIAYCWHSVDGYSKFGSYTGNNSADGPFIYCGFRPAFVMVKNTSSTGAWIIHDSSRNDYNPSIKHLRANGPDTENSGTAEYIDILSNGWKSRGAGVNVNYTSSTTFIYMAFSEQPFKFSNAR